jgi:hypothetical protein
MANQEFKKGDRVKIPNLTGTIVGTKLEDNSIKYHVKIDQGRIYTWVFQNSLEHMDSNADNFKQTITIETERKTGETIIRISNPKFTTDEPTVRGTIIGYITNKSNEPKITDEQRTVLEGLSLLGYRYLACNKDNHLYAYSTHPWKDKTYRDDVWFSGTNSMYIRTITDVISNLCSWEDEKPTSIEWLLGKKDNNE